MKSSFAFILFISVGILTLSNQSVSEDFINEIEEVRKLFMEEVVKKSTDKILKAEYEIGFRTFHLNEGLLGYLIKKEKNQKIKELLESFDSVDKKKKIMDDGFTEKDGKKIYSFVLASIIKLGDKDGYFLNNTYKIEYEIKSTLIFKKKCRYKMLKKVCEWVQTDKKDNSSNKEYLKQLKVPYIDEIPMNDAKIKMMLKQIEDTDVSFNIKGFVSHQEDLKEYIEEEIKK